MSTFDLFYASYPRKVGKRAAELAFARSVKRGNDPKAIISAATRYRDDPDRKRKDIEFTPHPATWLNQDRFLDSPPVKIEQPRLIVEDGEDRDERPQCCIDHAEDGIRHWLEAHATPEQVTKAKAFGLTQVKT